MNNMTEALARFKMEAISDWNGYTRIMGCYLLHSAVPILFSDLLCSCSKLHNPEFNKYKLARMNPSRKRFFIEEPALTKGHSPSKENNAHQAVWTKILMEQLAEFSKLRLLGEQTPDMHSYHKRSYNYIRLMGMILCHLYLPGTQERILGYYLDMLRDYLTRNMPGLPENASDLPLADLLKTCEDIYDANRAYTGDDKGNPDNHYINFRQGAYGTSLLDQIKDIALDEKAALDKFPNLRFYLSNVELLYTYIIYVYMVEFVCYNSPASTDIQKQYNLIKRLQNIGYESKYQDYLEDKRNQAD